MIHHRQLALPSLAVVLLVSLSACSTPQAAGRRAATIDSSFYGAEWIRTELYFGMNIPGGGTVSRDEWKGFLDSIITPRFPNGLTVIEGYGQYREASGSLTREESRLLILLHHGAALEWVAIEEIRTLYKSRFNQESVLRVNMPVGVGF